MTMRSDLEFGKFMTEVMNRADRLSFERCGHPLTDKYHAPSSILKTLGAICDKGWDNFTELAKVVTKDSYSDFTGAMPPFLFGQTGSILTGSLAFWGGRSSIKELYRQRPLIEDIKHIGDNYEMIFKYCDPACDFESMAHEAAERLYNLR